MMHGSMTIKRDLYFCN